MSYLELCTSQAQSSILIIFIQIIVNDFNFNHLAQVLHACAEASMTGWWSDASVLIHLLANFKYFSSSTHTSLQRFFLLLGTASVQQVNSSLRPGANWP